MARHYGVKILTHSGKFFDFIETGSLNKAHNIIMAVDMKLDHSRYYSQAGWIMEKTYQKWKEARA
jgi:hypothetical protein